MAMHAPRRSFRKLATYATLALVFAACAKKAAEKEPPADLVDKPVATLAGAADGKALTKNEGTLADQRPRDATRKIIRTGRLDLVIDDYDATREKLEAIVKAAGGYVDSTQVAHHKGAVGEATIVLRLPSDAFGAIMPKLRALGEIASESTSADDITAQYVDLSARLTSAKTLEKRLLELAAERTGNVENLLAVERELARVRGEIEGYEGQIRQWNDQVAMSTLTLGLSTRAPVIAANVEPDPTLGQRISHAFSSSVEALRNTGAAIAVSFIAFLPWLLFLIPGAVIGRRLYRRHQRRLPRAIVHPAEPAAPTNPAQS
jgi:uncharacterized protein DUF4349